MAIRRLVQTFNVIAGKNRAFVEQELQKVFGKISISTAGSKSLTAPGFSAREIRIADDPRFAATPIVRAKELILGISCGPSLGRIVIDSLVFREPELQIITDEAASC